MCNDISATLRAITVVTILAFAACGDSARKASEDSGASDDGAAADPAADTAPVDAPDDRAPNSADAPLDVNNVDGGCSSEQTLSYTQPGCGTDTQPVCVDKVKNACAMLNYYCACDGVTTMMTGGCGGINDRPYLYRGACRPADAGIDGAGACQMEMSVFTCLQGSGTRSIFACCPATFDGTTLPGCDAEDPDERTSTGTCGGARVLHRVSVTGGDMTCVYSDAGALLGLRAIQGTFGVIPFCMISHTAVAGEAIPASCDPSTLPLVRTCTH